MNAWTIHVSMTETVRIMKEVTSVNVQMHGRENAVKQVRFMRYLLLFSSFKLDNLMTKQIRDTSYPQQYMYLNLTIQYTNTVMAGIRHIN